jgi:hypothetical protein
LPIPRKLEVAFLEKPISVRYGDFKLDAADRGLFIGSFASEDEAGPSTGRPASYFVATLLAQSTGDGCRLCGV